MTGWTAKRFWTAAEVVPAAGGFEVRLDGRPVRTPGKSPLILPTKTLAEAVAAEWDAQEGTIRPDTMPATRTANSAIEKVAPQMGAVADYLAEYGETDLLCYRAAEPEELVRRQALAWDPWLDWAAEVHGARLVAVTGVMPRAQDPAALAALRRALGRYDAFALAALHDLVTLPGSLILGLAAAEGAAPSEALWQASRVDEDYQAELWGRDDEAEAAARRKAEAFSNAKRFLDLSVSRGG